MRVLVLLCRKTRWFFPIQTNVVESISPKSATSTLTVICDNHHVDVSDKLIYKVSISFLIVLIDLFNLVGDDTIEDDISKTPISKCGLQDGGESKVGDDTIEDDMSKTPISICGLQDGVESEDACVVIEVDSSEKSFIESSITPMKCGLP
ncbi:unnamed protein product [Lactuca saligna]|uniref:Uncharacterized protein n=1 Tax=Lactuca saligna TaxID=75948 RepID=A0AA35YK64_LACSI|nr:unnamed protein product [Lactuca saligna]